MDSSHLAMIAAILLLLCFSAYFSATETAFSSLSKIRLKNMAASGDRRAAQAQVTIRYMMMKSLRF